VRHEPATSELPCSLTVASDVPLDAGRVWARVSTMEGVNAELMPLMRMTVPPEVQGRSLMLGPVGEPMFRSWFLLGGVLPVERHTFCLESIEEGHFLERSSSWLQAVWRHERWVVPTETGCRVTDELAFRPRLPLIGALLVPIVRVVFEHRHRRLARWARDEGA